MKSISFSRVSLIIAAVMMCSQETYASSGLARDGLLFALVLVAFLLILAGLLYGVNYLHRNGRRIVRKIRTLALEFHQWLRSMWEITAVHS